MPRNPQATAGTSNGAGTQNQNTPPPPGAFFGVPKLSTTRRFVPDQGNTAIGATPSASSTVNVPTTRLDQLDIVVGEKMAVSYTGKWTKGSGETLTTSPLFPANILGNINYKLQAAYNTLNGPAWLLALMQYYRPMWGNRQVGVSNPDTFAAFNSAITDATDFTATFNIDVPFAIYFDEYYDLTASGDATRKVYDTWVTPYYMAAQARVVVPTITINSQLGTNDVYNSPISKVSADTTSAYADGKFSLHISRDAFFSAPNAASNPPMYPWMYTRDFFQQPTAGQNSTGVLIQNTGVSVGQVLSLCGAVYDPAANSSVGGVVSLDDIESFEIVTGGTLQNIIMTPDELKDRMRSMYGSTFVDNIPDGAFVFDFALNTDGGYLSNANAINTYLLNGVQLNINFKSGSAPGSTAYTVLGVEALKLATS